MQALPPHVHSPIGLDHNAPIGVFDSGVGGLSVLHALLQTLPHERYVYIADAAHAPYGERDDAHVLARATALTDYLVRQHHIKALVVACNTATAVAIQALRSSYAELPIVGLEPAIKPAAASSKTGVIGVMATRATLRGEKFRKLLADVQQPQQPQYQQQDQPQQGRPSRFVLQACDGLADAIERNQHTRISALCEQYTHALGAFGSNEGQIDTLVLGCTHYPFAAAVLQQLTGASTQLLDSGLSVALQTQRVLAANQLLAPVPASATATSSASDPTLTTRYADHCHWISTGSSSALQEAVQRWLGCSAQVAHAVIPSKLIPSTQA